MPDYYGSKHTCLNCGKVWSRFQLRPIQEFSSRVSPEDEDEPQGECPSCGALCYAFDEATDGHV